MKAIKKVWNKTLSLYCYKRCGFSVASLFFIKSLMCKVYMHFAVFMFRKKWLVKKDGVSVFDFNGALIPGISTFEFVYMLKNVFEDTFLISCFFEDKYDKKTVELVDSITAEGPYGYEDGRFDVTVKEGDVVIDAGAWVGDFGAYSASRGALAYCFEPASVMYGLLCETAKLNENKIVPIKLALGDEDSVGFISGGDGGASSAKISSDKMGEEIWVTTLDSFVKEHNLERVDFIKSDIEGFERNLLMGARETLRKFAPKLAICTYHLPDDPIVLAQIIKEANPNYKIVQMRHKLFAAVV